MTVKTAKEHIVQIENVCNEINVFDETHKELNDETGFLCDAVAFLCDYKEVLRKEIDKAELKI